MVTDSLEQSPGDRARAFVFAVTFQVLCSSFLPPVVTSPQLVSALALDIHARDALAAFPASGLLFLVFLKQRNDVTTYTHYYPPRQSLT